MLPHTLTFVIRFIIWFQTEQYYLKMSGPQNPHSKSRSILSDSEITSPKVAIESLKQDIGGIKYYNPKGREHYVYQWAKRNFHVDTAHNEDDDSEGSEEIQS